MGQLLKRRQKALPMNPTYGKPQTPPQPNPQAAQNYLRTRVLTATPEQLQMMLYDGAIRFTDAGKAAIIRKDWEATYLNLSRAQKIITELSSSLKPSIAPELCAKLSSLYNFIYRKLV